jgi:hypothetical protein
VIYVDSANVWVDHFDTLTIGEGSMSSGVDGGYEEYLQGKKIAGEFAGRDDDTMPLFDTRDVIFTDKGPLLVFQGAIQEVLDLEGIFELPPAAPRNPRPKTETNNSNMRVMAGVIGVILTLVGTTFLVIMAADNYAPRAAVSFFALMTLGGICLTFHHLGRNIANIACGVILFGFAVACELVKVHA